MFEIASIQNILASRHLKSYRIPEVFINKMPMDLELAGSSVTRIRLGLLKKTSSNEFDTTIAKLLISYLAFSECLGLGFMITDQ